MAHAISCDCGRLTGALSEQAVVNRCVCYCADCQAFARFLKRENEILDGLGGTDVIQTAQANVTFGEGKENLACMRLTPRGLLRWYAKCCNTPIGNTPADFRVSFVGLVHNCLERGGRSLDEAFGPVRTHAYPAHARGEPRPKTSGMAKGIARAVGQILKARLTGRYKQTPFFSAQSGAPVVAPTVLGSEELDAVKKQSDPSN